MIEQQGCVCVCVGGEGVCARKCGRAGVYLGNVGFEMFIRHLSGYL